MCVPKVARLQWQLDMPICKICQKAHWSYEPHIRLPAWLIKPVSAKTKPHNRVVTDLIDKVDTPALVKYGKYADKEKRKAYRRKWMANKRAATKTK